MTLIVRKSYWRHAVTNTNGMSHLNLLIIGDADNFDCLNVKSTSRSNQFSVRQLRTQNNAILSHDHYVMIVSSRNDDVILWQ